MKNKHGENISQEKDMKNPMKNDNPMKNGQYKEIKKIVMMMKKNFKIELEINKIKRKLKSLDESNANEFKDLAREYVQLTDGELPKDLFTSGSTHPYIEKMYSTYHVETQDLIGDTDGVRKKNLWDDTDDEEMKLKEDPVSGNKNGDLFGVINEKEANEADETDETDEANKAPVYEFYANYLNMK